MLKTAEAGVTQLQNEVLALTKTELGNLGDVLKKS